MLDGRYHHDGDGDGWEEPLSLVYSVCHWMLLFAKKKKIESTKGYLHIKECLN